LLTPSVYRCLPAQLGAHFTQAEGSSMTPGCRQRNALAA
jgi:hypothetical protein